MMLTVEKLHKITGNTKYETRKRAYLDRINTLGAQFGLTEPAVLAQMTAQVLHESGNFLYLNELWKPTAAQKRYEGREDLGNTERGDGRRFSGHGEIQTTGRFNHRTITVWGRKRIAGLPDFEKEPRLLGQEEWVGLSSVWYFASRPKLIQYCRDGNIEMVTRLVNGGLNGYADRLKKYDRTALVMLGYGPIDVSRFQTINGLESDGISGPLTRAALHKALKRGAVAKKTASRPQVGVQGVTASESLSGSLVALFSALVAFFRKLGGK